MTLFAPHDGPRVFALPPGIDFTRALVAGLDARLAGQPPEAAARLERAQLEPGRLQIHRLGRLTLLDDSYNSSPAAASAARRALIPRRNARAPWFTVRVWATWRNRVSSSRSRPLGAGLIGVDSR